MKILQKIILSAMTTATAAGAVYITMPTERVECNDIQVSVDTSGGEIIVNNLSLSNDGVSINSFTYDATVSDFEIRYTVESPVDIELEFEAWFSFTFRCMDWCDASKGPYAVKEVRLDNGEPLELSESSSYVKDRQSKTYTTKNMVLHDNIKAGINEVVHYVSIDLISTNNCDARYRREFLEGMDYKLFGGSSFCFESCSIVE